MKTIELHGILAKKFGRFFKLEVKTAKEACYAIACQMPEFKQFMLDSEKLGYKFAVFCGKRRNRKNNIGEDQINNITTSEHIHIVPKVIGAGAKVMGWLQVIAGVVMIGVGIATGGASIALIGAGIGLLLGGVSTLLMPTPNTDVNNEEGNKPNNGFGGAVTTVAQGNPIPILYGVREVGGFVASAGIYAEDGTAPVAEVSNKKELQLSGFFHGVRKMMGVRIR